MNTEHRTKAQVVDLLRYKHEQSQRRLDFGLSAPRLTALAPVTPFRPLTPREVAHRQRMALYLASQPKSQSQGRT